MDTQASLAVGLLYKASVIRWAWNVVRAKLAQRGGLSDHGFLRWHRGRAHQECARFPEAYAGVGQGALYSCVRHARVARAGVDPNFSCERARLKFDQMI
jgi:hypothetical protein